MKSIHLSDLHFGRYVSQEKLRSLAEDITSHAPELIVITGDLTDRGSLSQFRWARDFLKSLGIPFISVPGNREVCITAVWEWMFPRFAMRRYSHFFGSPDRILYAPEHSDVVFLGVNSVHAFPSWPGAVSLETRYWLRNQAARFPDAPKVLFLHHPVLPVIRSSTFWAHSLSDASELLNICSQTGINLVMQGHKHRSAVMEIHLPEQNSRVVVSSCGAPLMSRWDPVYHIIEFSRRSIVIHTRELRGDTFTGKDTYEFLSDGQPVRGRVDRSPHH